MMGICPKDLVIINKFAQFHVRVDYIVFLKKRVIKMGKGRADWQILWP